MATVCHLSTVLVHGAGAELIAEQRLDVTVPTQHAQDQNIVTVNAVRNHTSLMAVLLDHRAPDLHEGYPTVPLFDAARDT